MAFEMFRDRQDAGRQLAQHLLEYEGKQPVVLAIPHGGVPIGYEIAKQLDAELDLVIPHKIPIPWNPEASVGAIMADGTMILNESMVRGLRLSREEIERAAEDVRGEIIRRMEIYSRTGITPPSITGRPVILTDDGLASGYTMLAAIESLRKAEPSAVVVAVPVASMGAARLVMPEVNRLVALIVSERLPFSVTDYYMDSREPTDDGVLEYLNAIREYKEEAA